VAVVKVNAKTKGSKHS